jgi:hypothetical protein
VKKRGVGTCLCVVCMVLCCGSLIPSFLGRFAANKKSRQLPEKAVDDLEYAKDNCVLACHAALPQLGWLALGGC